MRTQLIALALCVLLDSGFLPQTKSTPKKAAIPWSATILLNDDWLGIYKDKKWSELSPETRARITDHQEAATQFGTAFALDEECKGLILLFHSRAGLGLSPGRYWWLALHLGPTKETALEEADREVKTFNEQGRVPYVHIDNPWFNWAIEHYLSPGYLGETDEFHAEDSDPSPESAAHRVCLFVKSGGAVFGGSAITPRGKH